MAGPFYLDLANLLPFAASLVVLGLGFWLLYLNGRKPMGDAAPARALAVLLLIYGSYLLFNTLGATAAARFDEGALDAWTRLSNPLVLTIDLAGIYFICVYPRRRTWIGTTQWGPWVLVAVGATIAVVSLVDPRLVQTANVHASGTAVFEHLGPLLVLSSFPTFATIALVFLLDHLRAASRHRTVGPLLASVAFAGSEAWFLATGVGLGVVYVTGNAPDFPDPTGAWWVLFVQIAADLVLFTAIAFVALRAARREGAVTRSRLVRYLAVLGVGAAIGIGTALGAASTARAAQVVFGLSLGLISLFFGGLLTYVVVRHRLLDIDVRLRWTIRQSTLAAIFVGVFFIVSESVAEFLGDRNGTYVGILTTGLLLFALAPLQHFAKALSDRALPPGRSWSAMPLEEREAFYREQARLAWSDGNLSRDERRLLDDARKRLGLTTDQAASIEAEVSAG